MKPSSIVPEKIIGFKGGAADTYCDRRDSIIYALGIGMKQESHLPYLNQSSSNFMIFPTFATCLGDTDILTPLINCPGIPEFNPLMILYAEHKLTMERPIRPDIKYRTTSELVNVQDKGKITIFTVRMDTFDM